MQIFLAQTFALQEFQHQVGLQGAAAEQPHDEVKFRCEFRVVLLDEAQAVNLAGQGGHRIATGAAAHLGQSAVERNDHVARALAGQQVLVGAGDKRFAHPGFIGLHAGHDAAIHGPALQQIP